MRRPLALTLVLAATVVGLTACGTKKVTVTGPNGQTTETTVKNIHFAKTKFLLHAGLAIGAFHRYIYKPLKSHGFSPGAPKRKRTIAKAAAAALFTYHELKTAREDAQSSDLLRNKLLGPLNAFLTKVQGLPALLKSGSLGGLSGAAGAFQSLKGAAGKAGVNLKELPTPSLGG